MAGHAYERFLELWAEADEAFASELAEARERLEALTETEVGSGIDAVAYLDVPEPVLIPN